MEIYNYEPINTWAEANDKEESKSWTPFLRQLFICSGAWTAMFIGGLGIGAPTVLIAQWRREANSEGAISGEMSSWLTCAAFYIAPFWIILWTVLTKYIGRKIPFGLSCFITLIGFIIFYYSTTLTHLLISEIFKASGYASYVSVTVLVITEYTSPKYRGWFLAIKSASSMWGMWVSNAVGTFFHWRYIGVTAFICFAYSMSTMIFWPESPLWLATRGRFKDCAVSHRWLKGTGKDSERELKNLIEAQKENLRNAKKIPLKMQLNNFAAIVTESHFYKPLLVSSLITIQYTVSGKLTSALYAIEFFKKMTKKESSAYTVMLILDGVTVFSMYAGSFIARYVKRRTQTICTSVMAVTFLFTISLYLYLIDMRVVEENDIIIVVLLTAFTVGMACGPMILCFTLYGELIPTDSRTTYSIVGGFTHIIFNATYIKTAPYIFNNLSMALTFLIYGISASITTLLIYVYLPETKDKTLAEIENIFRKKKQICKNTGQIDDVE